MRSNKRSFFDDFWYFFEVWVQRCPRVVPGTLQGSLQGQNCSKMGLKMTEKHQQMLSKGFLKTFLKDMRSEHVSKQLLAFFSFFLLMQRKILCHICPSKVPTLIHLARGENLRWMSPRWLPDASQGTELRAQISELSAQSLERRAQSSEL